MGRPPKGGGDRVKIQTQVPGPAHEFLTQEVAERSDRRVQGGLTKTNMSSVGAYYVMRGINAARADEGLDPLPIPSWLEQEITPDHDPDLFQ